MFIQILKQRSTQVRRRPLPAYGTLLMVVPNAKQRFLTSDTPVSRPFWSHAFWFQRTAGPCTDAGLPARSPAQCAPSEVYATRTA